MNQRTEPTQKVPTTMNLKQSSIQNMSQPKSHNSTQWGAEKKKMSQKQTRSNQLCMFTLLWHLIPAARTRSPQWPRHSWSPRRDNRQRAMRESSRHGCHAEPDATGRRAQSKAFLFWLSRQDLWL